MPWDCLGRREVDHSQESKLKNLSEGCFDLLWKLKQMHPTEIDLDPTIFISHVWIHSKHVLAKFNKTSVLHL